MPTQKTPTQGAAATSGRKASLFAWSIAFVLLFIAVVGVINIAPPASSQSPSGIHPDTIGPVDSAQSTLCSSVTTCKLIVTTVAYSTLVFFIEAGSTTAPSAVAIHGVTLSAATHDAASAAIEIYGYYAVNMSTSSNVNIYANFSAGTSYWIQAVDLTNVIVIAAPTDTTCEGTSGASSNTAWTCQVGGLTPTVAGDMLVFAGASPITQASVASASGTQIALDSNAAVTGDYWYLLDSGTGAANIAATAASSNKWAMSGFAFEQASVPAAPTALATGTITTSSVALTWTDAKGPITGALVWQASYASGACGSYSTHYSTSSGYNSYTVTGLSGGLYCFQVDSENSTGWGLNSTPVTDVLVPHTPPAVTGVTDTPYAASLTSVSISWTAPLGTVSNYTVRQVLAINSGSCNVYTSAHSAAWTNVASGTVLIITGLSTGTYYCWGVAAWNSTSTSANILWSSSLDGTTNLIGQVTSLATSGATQTTVTLTWAQPAGVGTIYNDTVNVGTSCGPYGVQIDSVGVVTTYTVVGLNPNTPYCFAVNAWTNGAGALSATLQVTTLAATPSSPTGVTAKLIRATSVWLAWTSASVVSGTLINATLFWGTSCGTEVTGVNGGPGTWTNTVNLLTPVQNTNLSGLSTNTAYCVGISDWTQAGMGPTGQVSFTSGNPVPSAPTVLTYTAASHTTVTMSWTQAAGTIVNDTLSYGTTVSCGGSRTTVSTEGAATSFTVTGLTAATTYYWEVAASTSGGTGVYSSCVTGATYSATPPAPYDLASVLVGGTYIYIVWTNPAGYSLTDNKVYVSNAGGACGTWSQTIDIGAVQSFYNISGLTPASNYCIEATAIDGESPLSAPLYASTVSVVVPPLFTPGSNAVLFELFGLLAVFLVCGIAYRQYRKSRERW